MYANRMDVNEIQNPALLGCHLASPRVYALRSRVYALRSPIVQALYPCVQKSMCRGMVEEACEKISFYRFQCGSTFSP